MGDPTPILPTFQQHQQSAWAATSTRVDADKSWISRTRVDGCRGMGHKWILTFTLMLGRKIVVRIVGIPPWSPDAVLMDTVARLQWDLDDMRTESRYLRTPGVRDSLRQPRQVTFTSTKVTKFAGVTGWINTGRCSMPSYGQMDGTTRPLHCSCSPIWRGTH